MYGLGVDLGTTYTAAAVWRSGRTEVVALGDRAPVVPSVLLLRDDGGVLVGEAAVRRSLVEPQGVAREFKRRLGDPVPLLLAGRPMSAQALMARLLTWVVNEVSTREGAAPDRLVVTCPANWGPHRRELLELAIEMADVGPAEVVTEPVAAAVHVASTQRFADGDLLAVYDLGGGTFDAAVLRKNGEQFELLGNPAGIEQLGGVDFDAAVFGHVVRALGRDAARLQGTDEATAAGVARLQRDCTEAKEALSADSETVIPVTLPNLVRQVRMTRAEFEELIRPALVDTVMCLRRAMVSAGVGPQELAAVVLAGGSSRIPLVAEMLGTELGRPIAVTSYPKSSVALGAARLAGQGLGPDSASASGSVSRSPSAGRGRADGPVPQPSDGRARSFLFRGRGSRSAARPAPGAGSPVAELGTLLDAGPARPDAPPARAFDRTPDAAPDTERIFPVDTQPIAPVRYQEDLSDGAPAGADSTAAVPDARFHDATRAPAAGPGPAAGASRPRRGQLWAVAGALLLVLVVIAVFSLTRKGGGGATGGSSPTPRRTSTTASSPPVSASITPSTPAVLAPDGTWTGATDMPAAVEAAGVTTFKDRLWVVGGDARGEPAVSRVEIYDPVTASWTDGPTLPIAVHDPAAVSDGSALYVIGGGTADGTIESTTLKLNDTQDGWLPGPDLPAPRWAGVAVWDGSRIVYGGGRDKFHDQDEVWALQGDSWRLQGLLHRPRNSLVGITDGAGSTWFLAGEVITGTRTQTAVGDTDVLNGGRVRPGPPVSPRRAASGVYLPGYGPCLIGGKAGNSFPAGVDCPQQPAGRPPVPDGYTPRAGLVAALLGRQLITAGGFNATRSGSSALVEVLNLRAG